MVASASIEILGIFAGIITTSSFVPQIIKGYKTKEMEDISYYMFFIFGFGFTLWLIYGILINSIAIIAANIAGITFDSTILSMKKYYSK
jgi:MtN3 and saliva related transmembrane protein|tara:strand:- start:2573 stop:2839 length:267 start_codon:yes stop_codon:yes gene_type:complete